MYFGIAYTLHSKESVSYPIQRGGGKGAGERNSAWGGGERIREVGEITGAWAGEGGMGIEHKQGFFILSMSTQCPTYAFLADPHRFRARHREATLVTLLICAFRY